MVSGVSTRPITFSKLGCATQRASSTYDLTMPTLASGTARRNTKRPRSVPRSMRPTLATPVGPLNSSPRTSHWRCCELIGEVNGMALLTRVVCHTPLWPKKHNQPRLGAPASPADDNGAQCRQDCADVMDSFATVRVGRTARGAGEGAISRRSGPDSAAGIGASGVAFVDASGGRGKLRQRLARGGQ